MFIFLFILLQKNAKGQVLFDKICEKIEVVEKDYFGLRYIDEKDGQVIAIIARTQKTESNQFK